jgi:hypothetical protein
MDTFYCSHASASSVLTVSPPENPWLLSQYPLSCCSPQVPWGFGASGLFSGDDVPIPCLHVPTNEDQLVLRLPHLHTVTMKFFSRDSNLFLLWFRVMVMMRFLFCALLKVSCLAPADAAGVAVFPSFHIPKRTLDGLQAPPR